MHWVRWLRWILAVLLVGLVVLLGWNLRKARRPARSAGGNTGASGAADQRSAISAFDFVKTENGERRFRVVARTLRSFEGGEVQLDEVEITLFRPGGREVKIRGQTARFDKSTTRATLEGNVTVEEPEGLRLEAPSGRYEGGQELVEAGPVAFRRGNAVGRADRLTYDVPGEVLVLDGGVEIALEPERSGGAPGTLACTHLTWDGKSGAIEARSVPGAGPARLAYDGTFLEAPILEARMDPAGSRVETLAAFPGARLRLVHRSLHARRVGEGNLYLSGDRGDPARDVAAERIDIRLGAEGEIESLEAVGAATAESGGTDPVRMGAGALHFSFGPGGEPGGIEGTGAGTLRIGTGTETKLLEGERITVGLGPGGVARTVRAEGGPAPEAPARFTENRPPAEGPARVAVARTIEGEMAEGGRGLRSARLSGRARIHEGDSVAGGEMAVVDPSSIVLTGNPYVESPSGRVYGDRITYRRAGGAPAEGGEALFPGASGGELFVEGNVRSTQNPGKGEGLLPSAEGAGQGVLYATADRLLLPGGGDRAEYRGDVVWKQGDSMLAADEVDADRASSTLLARGNVRTRVRLEPKEGKVEEPAQEEAPVLDPRRLVDGKSGRMTYRKAEGIILYEGAACLSQGEQKVCGERVDIRLDEAGKKVERLDAEGDAEVRTLTREGWADRIGWDAPTGLVRLEGGGRPARVRDRAKGATARGDSLTFSTRDDRLEIESGAHGRSTTTYGGGASGD